MPSEVLVQSCPDTDRTSLAQRSQRRRTALIADYPVIGYETPSRQVFSGSVLTPARVCEAFLSGKLDYDIWEAIRKAMMGRTEAETAEETRPALVQRVFEQLLLELASHIGDLLPGPCSIFIHAEKGDDMSSIIETAQRMQRTCAEQGVPRESIILSIPATKAGVLAAQRLTQEGALTSLHFVTSLLHAQACVEAGVSAISISVGPLLDIYEKERKRKYKKICENPGFNEIESIIAYVKHHKIKTKVYGIHFRNAEELGLLSGFDAVCLSAEQANKGWWSHAPVTPICEDLRAAVALRVEQTKFPTDLLSGNTESVKWFPSGRRALIDRLLDDSLETARLAMVPLRHAVAEQIQLRVALQMPYDLFILATKNSRSVCWRWSDLPEVYSADVDEDTHTYSLQELNDVMDEVF